MTDFFDTLAADAKATIESGYYQNLQAMSRFEVSFKAAIQTCKVTPVITEIKSASPSLGTIRTNLNAKEVALAMQNGGATALSVLTEPKHFNGSLETLIQARLSVKLPILMKDIVLHPIQVDAAQKAGANAVLLISALYSRGYGKMKLEEMIAYAHEAGLEVLLETHNVEEFGSAIKTDADLIGINNRNLATLKIELDTTGRILRTLKTDKIVVSESGIQTRRDIQTLKTCGANAFLVGSSIMLNENVEAKVRELVEA
jgi:indole-3-glycerol phosphate synthase